MPKDASKNVDRYKVRGGHLNEYEYSQNQQDAATEKRQSSTNKRPKKSASGNTQKKRKTQK